MTPENNQIMVECVRGKKKTWDNFYTKLTLKHGKNPTCKTTIKNYKYSLLSCSTKYAFVIIYSQIIRYIYIYIYIYISYNLAVNYYEGIYIYIYLDRLSIIWKSDLTDKMKRSFFQAGVVSILLYGCTTWTLTKRLKKKLDGNYTRMLRAILNKFWRRHPTRHQLYSHLPPITKTIQVRRIRHAAHCWREARTNSSVMYSYGAPHMAKQKQDDQLEHTYSSYMRIRDIALKTCQKRWTIERSGERGSGISVLAAQHDDDDIYCVCACICMLCVWVCM